MKKNMTIPFFIPNLGCPHLCVFCSQGVSTGETSLPGAGDVIEKISDYISSPSASGRKIEVGFFGGSFTSIPAPLQEELLGAAVPFLDQGLISGIRVSARPDAIGPKELSLLKKHKVTTIEIGAQSFDDRVLELAERGHAVEDTVTAAERIKAEGFDLVIQIMTGLPGEGRDMAVDSALRAAMLSPCAVRIYPVIVIDGTRLAELYREKKYTALTLDEAVDRVKEQLKIFRDAGIPVIRIGVHPFGENETPLIIAGPYHTAFGFLAKSALLLDDLRGAAKIYLQQNPGSSDIKISIPEKFKEEYIGHKRSNIDKIKSEFALSGLHVYIHKPDHIVISRI